MTDGRWMSWKYIVDTNETGTVNVKGSYTRTFDNVNFEIYKNSDLLYSSTSDAAFDFNTTVAAGDQISFSSQHNIYWWEPRYLNATITAVPEPVTLLLLVLGGTLGIIRRK